ncbi:hypothetical protein BJ138DRAFT_995536, partial [Hygrophoropsis aurantiaca]
ADCRVRSWVRAPDMTPGTVIQGDVKILLDEACPEVESYTLGLRFKERVFFKILRRRNHSLDTIEDIDIFEPPSRRDIFGFPINSINNSSEWKVYEDAVVNKDIWLVHEEETLTFELKYQLDIPKNGDLVSKFGLLVPDTNYPPALDHRRSATHLGSDEIQQIESVYEYFIEILFANGTLREFPAGITAFQPLYLPSTPSNLKLTLPLEIKSHKHDALRDPLQSNYTAEITLRYDGIFLPDSSQNLSIVVYRSGYSNRTDMPTHISISTHGEYLTKWSDFKLSSRDVLHKARTTSGLSTTLDFDPPPWNWWRNAEPPPLIFPKTYLADSGADNETGQLVTTSSEPIMLSFDIERDHIPSFSARYQTLGTRLCLFLQVRKGVEEPYDRNDPFDTIKSNTVDDIPYDWVPRSKPEQVRGFRSYSTCTNVSVAFKSPPFTVAPAHYLSIDARTPIFVDPSTVPDWLSRSREERNLCAPLANHQTKVTAKGDEKIIRYFSGRGLNEPIYVGETWVKKVLPSLERSLAHEHSSTLVVQSDQRRWWRFPEQFHRTVSWRIWMFNVHRSISIK